MQHQNRVEKTFGGASEENLKLETDLLKMVQKILVFQFVCNSVQVREVIKKKTVMKRSG